MDIYHKILKENWGYDSFRTPQLEIIKSIAEGKDTLGLMPTGGGKSITFQVLSLSKPGTTIVITPLIALMKDQVENLRSRKIKATAIYSGMSNYEIEREVNNVVYGKYKFLYISPERFVSQNFLPILKRFDINLIAVDEAHCISQWGYDFRLAYTKIGDIRWHFPDIPILALTATATTKVVADIQDKLFFEKKNVFRKSFKRDNLTYLVREVDDKMTFLANRIARSKGSGIVYVKTRKRTKEIASMLQRRGITADYYHGGLETSIRDDKQNRWMKDQVRVIVSTNAFGMGIDKPDVRFVIHFDPSESLEAYYQEAGRGGRDGKRSIAVLLYNKIDSRNLRKKVTDQFPSIEQIQASYDAICNYYQIAVGTGKDRTLSVDLDKIADSFKLKRSMMESALRLLSLEGYMEYSRSSNAPAAIMLYANRNELYAHFDKYPQSEEIIMGILRSYGGIYTDYTYISEQLVAKRVGVKEEQVSEVLKIYARDGLLRYIPFSDSAIVRMLTERVQPHRVRISDTNYTKRREHYSMLVESVIRYATTKSCRSSMLVSYFGEKIVDECGTCDVCTSTPLFSQNRIKELHKKLKREIPNSIPISTFKSRYLGVIDKKDIKQLYDLEIIVVEGSNLRIK